MQYFKSRKTYAGRGEIVIRSVRVLQDALTGAHVDTFVQTALMYCYYCHYNNNMSSSVNYCNNYDITVVTSRSREVLSGVIHDDNNNYYYYQRTGDNWTELKQLLLLHYARERVCWH